MKNAAEEIGKMVRRVEKTVRLNGKFAEAIDKIAEITSREFAEKILRGEVTFTRKDIHEMAELSPEELKQIASHVGDEETSPRDVLKQILAEKEPKASAPEESVEKTISSNTSDNRDSNVTSTQQNENSEVQTEPSDTSDSDSEETAHSNNDITSQESDTTHSETESSDTQEDDNNDLDESTTETDESSDEVLEESEIKKELNQLIALSEGLKQYHDAAEINPTGLGQHLAQMKTKISSLEELIQEQETDEVKGFEL